MDKNWISYLSEELGKLEGLGFGFFVIWGLLGLIIFSLFQTWTNPRWQKLTRPILMVGVAFLLVGEVLLNWEDYWVQGMISRDFLGKWGELLLLFSMFIVITMLPKSKVDPEFFPLMVGGVLGAVLSIMTGHLLFMILTLELLSLVSYVMVAMENKDRSSSRSALQYLLFGLFSSAISLYGLSWLYGLTGTFDLESSAFLEGINEAEPLLWLPIFLLLIGTFMFKLSAFPFHFWTPQVYQKASYPLIAYLSTIPKIAGGFVFLRIFHVLSGSIHAENLQVLMLTLAGFSMTWGNLSALAQEQFKSMMAFSGVAHAGYILMGLSWMSPFGESAVVFYMTAYIFMNLGAVMAAKDLGDSDHYPSWRGKSSNSLYSSINLMVHLVALTGLPPSIGFVGKLYLFSSGLENMEESTQVVIVSILTLAVLNTLFSLFYYLKPAVWIFLRRGGVENAEIPNKRTRGILLGLLSLLVILFGVFGFDRVLDFFQTELWK